MLAGELVADGMAAVGSPASVPADEASSFEVVELAVQGGAVDAELGGDVVDVREAAVSGVDSEGAPRAERPRVEPCCEDGPGRDGDAIHRLRERLVGFGLGLHLRSVRAT